MMVVVKDKFNGDVIDSVQEYSEVQVEDSMALAVKSFETYKHFSVGQKAELLQRLIDLFETHMDDFAQLIMKEAGKPISYAKSEVNRCLETMKIGLRELYQSNGEAINIDYGAGEGRTAFTKRFPIGPILAISPFNFPLNLALHKIIPAFVSGCSVLLKPSPFAPLSALKFQELVKEAGYPENLLKVFLTSNELTSKMVEDDRFKLLSFTGSAEIGWMLKTKAGKKKVVLELGGDAAVYVHKTADLIKAAKEIAVGAYLYAGQICISTQRIIVDEEVYDDFKLLLIDEVKQLKTGNPENADVTVGPLIDAKHVDRIENWYKEALEAGANILVEPIINATNNTISPILLEGVSKESKLAHEEAFGPIAYLIKVKGTHEAETVINSSKYGLQCGVFTESIEVMKTMHQSLEVGAVIMNSIPGFRMDNMPYGGVKDSGLGREGLKYAIKDMTEERLLIF